MDEMLAIGLGVIGNMTGHLEQAGEAADFVAVRRAGPKGLFPFYVPNAEGPLGVWPISPDLLDLPEGHDRVQPEPEVALFAELEWDGDRVVALHPRWLAAFDDTSLRIAAEKTSHKKNWGPNSKGLSEMRLHLEEPFTKGFSFDRYRLTCFLQRGDDLYPYGVDSALAGYSCFHEDLLAFVVDRLAHQQDEGPLEDLGSWLAVAGRPPAVLLSIGATTYTPFGETTFVQRGDVVLVVVYDGARYSPEVIDQVVRGERTAAGGLSVLRRVVR